MRGGKTIGLIAVALLASAACVAAQEAQEVRGIGWGSPDGSPARVPVREAQRKREGACAAACAHFTASAAACAHFTGRLAPHLSLASYL